MSLDGKVSLVTGASRGIGAATARKLAAMGSDVVINYRSKGARAEEVAREISGLGRIALPVQADITVEAELISMMDAVQERFGRLDVLVLNASGGLEKGKAQDYAMTLNRDAQLQTAKLAGAMMPQAGRMVFVTSHWAHFHGQKGVVPGYEVVARSKHAGEQALRQHIPKLAAKGISLVIVSGDVIEGTITPRLLERMNPGLMANRPADATRLPTVEEFADVIALAASDSSLPSGHTLFVGSTDH